MLNAIIFDMDMTLVDSLSVCHEGTTLLAERFSLPAPTRAQVLTAISLPMEDFWLELWGESRPEWGEFMYHEIVPKLLKNTTIYPETPNLLGAAKTKGLLLGLATNRANPWLDLAVLDLAKYFDTAVGASDVPKPKPDPNVLLTVIRQLSVDPARVIYIGDAISDMLCARNAGIKALGLLQGGASPEALTKAGADWIRQDIGACQDVLDF